MLDTEGEKPAVRGDQSPGLLYLSPQLTWFISALIECPKFSSVQKLLDTNNCACHTSSCGFLAIKTDTFEGMAWLVLLIVNHVLKM